MAFGTLLALFGVALTKSPAAWAAAATARTPIEHLIVVIGENQSFDALFGAYVPRPGATVNNLLSQGIIDRDGRPGPNFARAAQRSALPQTRYTLNPPRGPAYAFLPRPRLTGIQDQHFQELGRGPDPRFPADLPNGPYQITRQLRYPELRDQAEPTLAGSTARLAVASGDPVHRFFQMWQQTGGDNALLDLYTWVGITTGTGGDSSDNSPRDTGQSGEVMGFVNMSAGDAPYFRKLADRYASSDNYHQAVMGGTGVNFFALATADLPVYRRDGQLQAPSPNQIENPDPLPGTDNYYQHDGFEGGSWVNCADASQPGVAAILEVLDRKGVPSRCEPGTFYLVNNNGAGFDRDGHPQPLGPLNFTAPPQTVPTIAELLHAHGVSWSWYTAGREAADLTEETGPGRMSLDAAFRLQYNDLGDPLVASATVMTRPELRAQLRGSSSFQRDVASGKLPAVSFVTPKNLDSGHPGYSMVASFEAVVKDVVRRVQANPKLWAHTAIVATADESGGYFDSGYIQTLDFFGDGPRVPLWVISPFARPGHVDHVYNDHASILKFIEYNWRLAPLSKRSRDNLPNPVSDPADPYRPTNGPAVGDLRTLFSF